MPLYSENFLNRVRAANDIVDVIGAALPLKRAGTNFVTLCPFHREKSPSFNVNPQRQIFHCFGCHEGGNVFKFVQKHENIHFTEAVERLAERARIPLEHEDNPDARHKRGLKDQLITLHEAICLRWQACLANEGGGQVARDYLEQRGVTPESVKEFRLGAAPESWDDTVNWARSKGLSMELLEQAGLVVRREGAGWYDRFRGRLIFPICDEQGRVIAFSGRVLQGDEKTRKYVNSPETILFTKGRVLYALDKAKRSILDAGHAVICEGQLDTIACHSAGIRNAVAPQGTALTADHARILRRYVSEVVLCFDGDAAGQKAAVRSQDELLSSGLAIRVASIPPPDDPDSYLKSAGREAFQELLQRAEGYFDFFLKSLRTAHDPATDSGRQAIVRAMGDAANKTGNPLVVEECARKCAGLLGLSPLSALQQFQRLYRQSAAYRSSAPSDNSEPSDGATGAKEQSRPGAPELWLLKFLMLAEPEALDWATAHLDPNWISHPTARRITELRLARGGLHGETNTDISGLLEGLGGDEFARSLVTEAASERRTVRDLPVQLEQSTRRLRDAWLDRQIQSLHAQLSDAGLPEEQRLDALRQQQALRAWKRQPLAPLGEA